MEENNTQFTMASWMPPHHSPMPETSQYPPIFDQDYTTILDPYENFENIPITYSPEPAYPLCPLCQGKKYRCMRYFHNTAIFPSPPHQLLEHIEQSYILCNRLESRFFCYRNHLIPSQEMKKYVKDWAGDVEGLVNAVFEFARSEGFELVEGKARTEEVLKWMSGIVEGLCGGFVGGMDVMRSKDLLYEFRKLWEGVWIGYLKDLERIGMGSGLENLDSGTSTL